MIKSNLYLSSTETYGLRVRMSCGQVRDVFQSDHAQFMRVLEKSATFLFLRESFCFISCTVFAQGDLKGIDENLSKAFHCLLLLGLLLALFNIFVARIDNMLGM